MSRWTCRCRSRRAGRRVTDGRRPPRRGDTGGAADRQGRPWLDGGLGPSLRRAGDSISIDDYSGGPGRGGASLLFFNRDDDFPQWRGRDLLTADPLATFSLLATDGATTHTLLDGQLPRLAALRTPPTFVTLTIGGNDLLGVYGDTRAARAVIDRVKAALTRALSEIGDLVAPSGRIVVGTVYDPSDGTGDAVRLGLPSWPGAVAVIAQLNDSLRAVAARHGTSVAEIGRHFHGHGLLAGDPRRPEPRPAERDLWFCHLIERNAWGAGGVREAFWAAAHPVEPGGDVERAGAGGSGATDEPTG